MKKNTKNSGLSALKLALIITGSIVAAAGIILILAKLIKKKKAIGEGCCCDCGCDCDDEWFSEDEDYLGDLRYDEDDEDGCCQNEDEIAAAVDEAIEAIEAVTEEE